MKIELREITIREVSAGYNDDGEGGVVGYGGQLNIRPKFQREFVYKAKQREAVIETVRKNFPLNVMYWVRNADGTYEVLDGQQRTISICQYVMGDFSLEALYFQTLTDDEQEQILDYKLMVYFCEGNDREKLDWFKTINIAGEKLTEQELRNAIYTGTWLTDAKKYFSKTGCVAYNMGSNYMAGSPIRQDYLETVLYWLSEGMQTTSKDKIAQYMADHQNDSDAEALWDYFANVIRWVQKIFPKYRKEMKGVDFGFLYNDYKNETFDAKALEMEITKLMQDEDVTKKSGIYFYVLTRNEKYLSVRTFSDKQKRESYEAQEGICPKCNAHFAIEDMEADHITPWSKGGKSIASNCQMLCKHDNRIKSGK
jgi:hypothetical protein